MWMLLLLLLQHVLCDDILEIRMPGVTIPHDDTYYHMTKELKSTIYITGYRAEAHSGVVHHMLLYGCKAIKDRGSSVWIGGAPCAEEPKILWSWALDAPEFLMPVNVSMEVGNVDIKFLVMELHYKVGQPETYKDTSGIDIHFTTTRTTYQAGIYLFMADEGTFPPNKKEIHLDLACNFTSPEINVFAYRTHAHNYAKLISGYRQHNETWSVIGSRDPRISEMFARTDSVVNIQTGDQVYARCEYDTTGANKTVVIGNTHHDEMCNLYLMYYTDSAHIKQIDAMCSTQHVFVVPKDEGEKTVSAAGKQDQRVMCSPIDFVDHPWYDDYFASRTIMYLFVGIVALLVGCPLGFCCKVYVCNRRSYKRPNDGFEKLFTPDEDDEEDEILYKSYKNSY